MNITPQTELKFEPLDKRVDDETNTAVARYTIMVHGQDTGVTEVVVSQGRMVQRSWETEDGTIHNDVIKALEHAGHDVMAFAERYRD